MINLIRNELTKISKKKSIYITLAITLAFIIIANFIYQMSNDSYTYAIGGEIEFYEEQLKGIDLKTTENKEMYLLITAFLITALVVYLIRRQSVK